MTVTDCPAGDNCKMEPAGFGLCEHPKDGGAGGDGGSGEGGDDGGGGDATTGDDGSTDATTGG
jgi:hypothetical protein